MKLALASIGLFGLSNAVNTYVATFDSNITGTVTIDNGHVIVDLDLSAEPDLPGNYSFCTSGGMKYHIHQNWTHSSDSSQEGSTMCGGDYTGGHWDPWQGCGSASGNSYCNTNTSTTGWEYCLPKSAYSADYDSDAFSAEVGDWNGKYGLITVDSDDLMYRNDSSFFEVTPEDVAGYSVVFHCNTGARAFCAPFVDSGVASTKTIPEQDTNVTIAGTYFDTMSNSSVALFYSTGAVLISVDPSNITDSTGCSEFSYGLFELDNVTWAESSNFSAVGDDCDDYLDSFYDPTHQCMNFSGSEYCDYGTTNPSLCGTGPSYSCNYTEDRYSCAPADFSGKFGMMTDSSSFFFMSAAGPDTLIPRTDDMVGKVFAFFCNDGGDIAPLACGPVYDFSSMDDMNTTTTSSPMASTTEDDNSGDYTYVATFGGDNGINGTVTIDNGVVNVDLDLSAEPALPGGFDTCTSGGLKYHIHLKWDHDSDDDQINATMCGAGYTGGHYDPWQGCGSASGNAYCYTTEDNDSSTCIPTSDYSADFDTDVFSAEIGDWNGKYGLISLDSDNMLSREDSSFYEVIPADVDGMSVVFHCNGGSRAFCAPFVESSTLASETIPDQDVTYDYVMADLDLLTDGSEVYLYSTGEISIDLDWASVEDSTGCDNFKYGIFNPSTTSMSSSATGEDCDDYIDSFYDPTHQCMNFSGSAYCNSTTGTALLCGSGSYSCDWDDDRFSCAPGDLSGKFGSMDASDTSFTLTESGPGTLIPPTDDMDGMVFAAYCGDVDAGITYFACAPLNGETETDGVVARSVVLAVVASLFAMLF